MKLFGSFTSPFARHCRIVLLETGQACDFVETDYAASAEASPAKKVPFLEDGELFLSDSAAIIRYLREKAGEPFCADILEYNQFCLINTALDAAINGFILQQAGISAEQLPYLQRQRDRVAAILASLEAQSLPEHAPYNDAQLRLACLLEWGQLRQVVDLAACPKLRAFWQSSRQYGPLADTLPPQ
ncbi:glutathione S-transferase [Pseudaeromonas sp. ZJS20]|uniref:glutathione S-transferase family protein n=1 Tax=Pseudaeromonas aegiceratis TaxID=3153928 RepID=UPI00390C8805